MLSHLFKLIWKKRRSSFLMMLEIFLSFLILFAVWSLLLYNFKTYAKPSGIETKNVWAVYLNFRDNQDSVRNEQMQRIKHMLQGMKEVKAVTTTSTNLPYSFHSTQSVATYEKTEARSTEVIYCDLDFAKVLGLQITEGRWFTVADILEAKHPVVVINGTLRDQLFEDKEALGKVIILEGRRMKVIGVVNNYKQKSDYSSDFCAFQLKLKDQIHRTMLLNVQASSGPLVEARIAKEINRLNRDASVEIQHLEEMQSNHNQLTFVPVLILLIVCGFLIFNVALGLTGVLWQAIQQRREEIGIRRAIGASENHILRQFIGEVWVLATLGMSIGVFLAIQFPILHLFDVSAGIYLTAIVLAIICIFILVTICAWYPSKQAAGVLPAIALHEN
ncbi:MAG: ABC transporter permease [Siphonobacter sp.]